MIYNHDIETKGYDLTTPISRHSGDEITVYDRVGEEELRLSWYLPPEKSGKHPVIVFIHGGGWTGRMIFPDQNGWEGDYLGYLARFFAEKGFLSVSMDYRMYRRGEDTYSLPALCGDVEKGCWNILEILPKYGGDENELYLLGESAGGHLAGMLAAMHPEKWKRVFLINPVVDLRDNRWTGFAPEGEAERYSLLCRIPENMPPVTILHGASDSVVDPESARAYHDRMEEMGLSCDFHYLKDANHAFLLAEYTEDRAACETGLALVENRIDRRG